MLEATKSRTKSEVEAAPPEAKRLLNRRARLFLRNSENGVMLILLALLVLISFVPADSLPQPPTHVNLAERFLPPAWAEGGTLDHPLGTDFLGRDLLSRIIYSARYTLLIAGLATLVATVAGTTGGLIAGFRGGWMDTVIMRIADILLAFPVILLVLALVAVVGHSLINLILVLALSAWAGYARVIRSAVLTLRAQEFIDAARSLGASEVRILWQHILPNIMSPVLVLSTFQVARFILTESAISFLGLGVAPPASTWGGMIGDGRTYLYDAWWVSAFPGLAIALTVLIFNFLGDAVRDAFDPFSVGRP